MLWELVLTTLALVLVIEGLLPAASPRLWRMVMIALMSQSNGAIRLMGFISLLSGAILMYLVHSGIL